MKALKSLIREIHRRSLWQVLGIYLVSAWIVYEVTQALVEGLRLPEWLPGLAVILLLIGLPVVLATAFVQEGGPSLRRSDPTLLPSTEVQGAAPAAGPEGRGVGRLLTWRNAIMGGVFAFALWGVVAAGLLLLSTGVGSPGADEDGTLDPDVVVVLPFRVSGAGELEYLREGMVDLLAAKLTGEGGPRAADPRTVMSAWRRRVETEDTDLPQEAAIELARGLGAGQVLLGGVVGTPTGLVLNASVLDVESGDMQAQAGVEGTPDALTALVDQLTAQLLAVEAGEGERRLAALTSTSLPALRAYLEGQAAYRGGRYEEAVRRFERALDQDSTFALAALGLAYAADWVNRGASFHRGLSLGLEHIERLSARDRAQLIAWAGPRYPEPYSVVEFIDLWRRAAEAAWDRPEPWYQLGDAFFHWVPSLGQEGAWEQAESNFRRALELDSSFAAPLDHLAELTALAGDAEAARSLMAAYVALDSLGDVTDFTRWHVAHELGDSGTMVALRNRIPQMSDLSLIRIMGTGQIEGIELDDVELAGEALRGKPGARGDRWRSLHSLHSLALNRGRPGEALALTEMITEVELEPREHLRRQILDALYWDGDVAAARAVLELEGYAEAALSPGLEVTQVEYLDLCVVEQWRLWHGQTGTARQAIERLRDAVPNPDSSVSNSAFCAALVEALLSNVETRADRSSALDRLESIMLAGPNTWFFNACGNLVVAHLSEAEGDLERALAAVRRRPYHWNDTALYLSSYLREEGRLAALTGDREGAIRAYQHYLALRADPEPALADDVNQVRAELAQLIEETSS